MSGYNEAAYKQARDTAIALPCPFERALLSLCATCCKSRKLLLAEREAISCTEAQANAKLPGVPPGAARQRPLSLCTWTRRNPGRSARKSARNAAASSACATSSACRKSIPASISRCWSMLALARHGDIADFPYSEIMRAIVHYEPRKRGDK
jgi:hypothetical protein